MISARWRLCSKITSWLLLYKCLSRDFSIIFYQDAKLAIRRTESPSAYNLQTLSCWPHVWRIGSLPNRDRNSPTWDAMNPAPTPWILPPLPPGSKTTRCPYRVVRGNLPLHRSPTWRTLSLDTTWQPSQTNSSADQPQHREETHFPLVDLPSTWTSRPVNLGVQSDSTPQFRFHPWRYKVAAPSF